MATKSSRNVTMEQHQAMWPGTSFTQDETVPYEYKDVAKYVHTMPGASMTFGIPDSDLGTIRGPIAKVTPMQQKHLANMVNEAVKADTGKPDWSLVPFEALEGMVRVLEFGANKYSRNNWMTGGGFSYRRVLTACMRHLFSYLGGEDKDPESGLSHIHHAQCNLLFLAMYITNKEKFNKDDRESR